MYKETPIIDQSLPANWSRSLDPPVPRPCIIVQKTPPSRFRRKKGYDGPTARHFNKNYARMPKDF